MELLQLTRAGDCEQSGNGALALGTPIAEHDLPPLHGRPEGSFGHVVGGCDRLFMHEGEEVGVMHEQRAREVRHLDVRGIDVAFCQREQTLLDRQHLRDQLRAREWGTARAGIATEAMPQPTQLPLQRVLAPFAVGDVTYPLARKGAYATEQVAGAISGRNLLHRNVLTSQHQQRTAQAPARARGACVLSVHVDRRRLSSGTQFTGATA